MRRRRRDDEGGHLYRNASGGEPLLASAHESAFEARQADGGETVPPVEAYQRAIWWLVGIGIVVAGAMIAWLDVAVKVPLHSVPLACRAR